MFLLWLMMQDYEGFKRARIVSAWYVFTALVVTFEVAVYVGVLGYLGVFNV